MTYQDIQIAFLNLIKKSVPNNLSLADEIAEILDVSKDSAYRRMRGETTLSLNEIQKLSNRFGVSIDTLLNTQNNAVSFQYRSINNESYTFEDYLQSILENLRTINKFEVAKMIYLAKDVPPFHHFQFPKLSEFKCFFWLKTILNHPKYASLSFEEGVIPKETINLGLRIYDEYVRTPSIEVWSFETINITLRQIEYYYECGLFKSAQEALMMADEVEKLLRHLKEEASIGKKFYYGDNQSGYDGTFDMYSNEVSIADTTIFFKMGETKITYIIHNNLNILTTTDKSFCEGTEEYIQNIFRKSSLISSSSEKERNRFFNRLLKKVDKLRDVIR
jgi:transcriptional regulator with XRE-family HTH domain